MQPRQLEAESSSVEILGLMVTITWSRQVIDCLALNVGRQRR